MNTLSLNLWLLTHWAFLTTECKYKSGREITDNNNRHRLCPCADKSSDKHLYLDRCRVSVYNPGKEFALISHYIPWIWGNIPAQVWSATLPAKFFINQIKQSRTYGTILWPPISILQRAVIAALMPQSPLSLMSGTMPACDAGTTWVKATLEGCDTQSCFRQRPVTWPEANSPSGLLANSIQLTAHIINARGETLITYEINPWFKFKRTCRVRPRVQLQNG